MVFLYILKSRLEKIMSKKVIDILSKKKHVVITECLSCDRPLTHNQLFHKTIDCLVKKI